jgi:cyclopropane fatty-acyl-phospholipid synthase-like methyltransferase
MIKSLAPYVSTPKEVVRKMLEIAKVKPGERVYDLGSGDGRIPIIAAQEFNAIGVGVELNERFIKRAWERVRSLGLENEVTFIQGDIFDIDLRDADIITMYLTTDFGEGIRFRERYRSHTIYLYVWTGKSP